MASLLALFSYYKENIVIYHEQSFFIKLKEIQIFIQVSEYDIESYNIYFHIFYNIIHAFIHSYFV